MAVKAGTYLLRSSLIILLMILPLPGAFLALSPLIMVDMFSGVTEWDVIGTVSRLYRVLTVLSVSSWWVFSLSPAFPHQGVCESLC